MAKHVQADSEVSMDMDAVDFGNLLGMMDDDGNDMEHEPAIIPPKDSDHNVLAGTSIDPSSINPNAARLSALADDIEIETPMTMDVDVDLDIPPYDEEEEEEEKKPAKTNAKSNDHEEDQEKEEEIDVLQPHIQLLLDETVMTLLQPEFYTELDTDARKDRLLKAIPDLEEWPSHQFNNEIMNVADAMSQIEPIKMYDQVWHMDKNISKDKDDEKQKEKYLLNKVMDLSELTIIPDSFFGAGRATQTSQDDDEDGPPIKAMATSGLDYLTSDAKKLLTVPFGAQKQSGIACGACGVSLKMKKSKRKRKQKFYYIGYKCRATGHEWVFHDYLCVKLRKIKEAIKDYVFEREKDENINVEDENALIKIETSMSQKASHRLRPLRKTTPRKGDHNYKSDYDFKAMDDEPSSDDQRLSDDSFSDELTDEEEELENKRNTEDVEQLERTIRAKNIEKLGYLIAEDVEIPRYIDFRRYRMNIKRILDRLNAEKKYKGPTYQERFGDLPQILLCCDLNEFGVALFEFVSHSLKSKMRKSLWHILEWLALEMPTNEILHLLKKHTHLLSKHELPNYDKVCKACMEGSKFPIACTLRLSAFMYERGEVDMSNRDAFNLKGEQYVNVSRKLLKEIESDHLFALLLMIPTDIGHQNVIEIALKYDLTYFLEEPRIVRVFSVIWFNGYDFLDPDNSFAEPDIAADTIFDKLWYEPGRFFFSPFGKFVVSSILYIMYLGLFSYVTYLKVYDYPPLQDINFSEVALWISSAGYVVYEVLEFTDSPKEYFSSMANYWDILIAINWVFLAYMRFVHIKHFQYDSDGVLDETAQRNTSATEYFMAGWSFQCIILWTRVASLFKISERAGPLIRMIMNMLGDIFNFFLIWALFFMGGSFAAYYIIGGDLQEVDDVELGTFSSVSFFIFKTLIGQQDWDKTASRYVEDAVPPVEAFNSFRSNMLQTLLFFYSIFGMILLLNLLIAMMASSYEAVKNKSLQEVNKQKVDTIYDLDRGRNIIPPPFNVMAYFLYMYWYAFEIVAFALTFGHRQFNEEYFSPINHALHQYSVGDIITFRDRNAESEADEEVIGKCVYKVPKAERTPMDPKRRRMSTAGRAGTVDSEEKKITKEDIQNKNIKNGDLVVDVNDELKAVYDADVIKVKKRIFKRRTLRIPSLSVENVYCRYCRFNISADHITIANYLQLFDAKGQHIDPDDKKYMKALISTQDPFGIPTPLTCNLCPNCYRPFKVLRQGPDVLNRMMLTLEIVSYFVFWMTLRWIILLVICVPAFILKVIKFVIKLVNRTVRGKAADQKTKSIMNTSEENDDYRAKVRQVSKQEEKTDAVVRRIDISVTRLETKLLGELNPFDDDLDDEEEEDHNLRSDEFDGKMEQMKKELDKKFTRIQQLLMNAGYME